MILQPELALHFHFPAALDLQQFAFHNLSAAIQEAHHKQQNWNPLKFFTTKFIRRIVVLKSLASSENYHTQRYSWECVSKMTWSNNTMEPLNLTHAQQEN